MQRAVVFRQEEEKVAEYAARVLSGAWPVHGAIALPRLGLLLANAGKGTDVHQPENADGFQLCFQARPLAPTPVVGPPDPLWTILFYPTAEGFHDLPVGEFCPVDLGAEPFDARF